MRILGNMELEIFAIFILHVNMRTKLKHLRLCIVVMNEVNKNMYNTNGFLVVLFCIRIQVTLKLNYQ